MGNRWSRQERIDQNGVQRAFGGANVLGSRNRGCIASRESSDVYVCEGFIDLGALISDCATLLTPSLHRFNSRDQLTENANMSDNLIVKAVAGTCVTFSFILAGRRFCEYKREKLTVSQEMQSPNPT